MSGNPFGIGADHSWQTWTLIVILAAVLGWAIHPLAGLLAGGSLAALRFWRLRGHEPQAAGPLFRVVRQQVTSFPFFGSSAYAEVRHLGLGNQAEIRTTSREELIRRLFELQAKWDQEWEEQCQAWERNEQRPLPQDTAETGGRLCPGYEPLRFAVAPPQPLRLEGWHYPPENDAGAKTTPLTPELPPMAGVLLARFWVAGTGFYLPADECPQIQPGTDLELQAEPTNEQDEFAVVVFYQGLKLGYVPRSDNRAISRLLQAARPLTCRLSCLDPQQAPWRIYEAEIYQLD